MSVSNWLAKLKAYAKRRDAFTVSAPSVRSEANKTDCLEQIAKAILAVRNRDQALKDRPVIESLKYEVGQSQNVKVLDTEVYRAIVRVRSEHAIEPNEWRKAIKSVLKLASPDAGPNRAPTQLLDLLETLSR